MLSHPLKVHHMHKGEIWLVDIPETNGHEQQGKRPVVLLAKLEADIAIVIPCTSNVKTLRFPHVFEIEPSQKNGLSAHSVALIFQLRAIDRKRLNKKIGTVSSKQIKNIDQIMKSMLHI